MKSRTGDFEFKKGKKYVKKQGSFSSKENTLKSKNLHRRMKSEERTSSLYLNPNQKKKGSKVVYHDKSASNRISFKNDFEDYMQVSTSRKNKNLSKKKKLEGSLPIVGNNSFGGYNSNINPVFSMLSSLNNSGALLGKDHISAQDKNSLSVQQNTK